MCRERRLAKKAVPLDAATKAARAEAARWVRLKYQKHETRDMWCYGDMWWRPCPPNPPLGGLVLTL